jgi:hypothetical protein
MAYLAALIKPTIIVVKISHYNKTRLTNYNVNISRRKDKEFYTYLYRILYVTS